MRGGKRSLAAIVAVGVVALIAAGTSGGYPVDDGSGCSFYVYMPQSYSLNEMTASAEIYCAGQSYHWELCVQRNPTLGGWYDFTCWSDDSVGSLHIERTTSCYGWSGDWRDKLVFTINGYSYSDYSYVNYSTCGY